MKSETSKHRGKVSQTHLQSFTKLCTQGGTMKEKDDKDTDGRPENQCDSAEDGKMEIPRMKNSKKSPKIRIHQAQKRKSVGSKGIKARDLKETDEETTELMRDVINVIIKQGSTTPSSWKKVMVKVLYKQKRSDETRKRPNILYLADVVHMFSTMLYNTAQQARQLPNFPDHCGFRKNPDHPLAYRLIVRKCRECEQTSG